jgi:histidyl-tRNA synthetase
MILMAHHLWSLLGLKDIRLDLNSLGQPSERLAHRAALIAYFEQHQDQLDEDAKRRLHSNPLRILDTKNPAMQTLVEGAPRLIDHLGAGSRLHFETVCAILDAQGVPYRINPRLVRGMDYYNLTVFEFITDQLGSQGTVCGGGRYDHLIEQVGGKPAPAVGWALGMERVLELVRVAGHWPQTPAPDAYAIIPDAAALPIVMPLLQSLRQIGVAVQMHASQGEGMGSMKSQFKKADASGARYALVFGEQELQAGQLALKSLRDGHGEQRLVALADWTRWAHSLREA